MQMRRVCLILSAVLLAVNLLERKRTQGKEAV